MKIAVILFDGFELLDVFGPVELLQFVPGYELEFYAPNAGTVQSSQGVEVVAPSGFTNFSGADLLLVPGGRGTRPLVADSTFVEWLASAVARSAVVASVCTGGRLYSHKQGH